MADHAIVGADGVVDGALLKEIRDRMSAAIPGDGERLAISSATWLDLWACANMLVALTDAVGAHGHVCDDGGKVRPWASVACSQCARSRRGTSTSDAMKIVAMLAGRSRDAEEVVRSERACAEAATFLRDQARRQRDVVREVLSRFQYQWQPSMGTGIPSGRRCVGCDSLLGKRCAEGCPVVSALGWDGP